MNNETRIINKNTGVIHGVDQVYYYDNTHYVVFTEDKKCFPSNIVRILTDSEKYNELSKYIVSSLNVNGSFDKLKITIKELNKQRNERINQIPNTPIVSRTSWLRKIVSHLSKLGRRVRG